MLPNSKSSSDRKTSSNSDERVQSVMSHVSAGDEGRVEDFQKKAMDLIIELFHPLVGAVLRLRKGQMRIGASTEHEQQKRRLPW